MNMDEVEVMERVLGEHGLDVEEAMRALLRTLIHRHVRCKRDPRIGAGGMGPRPTILEELIHITMMERDGNLRASRQFAGDQNKPASATEEGFEDAPSRGELAEVQQAIVELLSQCEQLARRVWGLEERDEDDDDRPPMRLVTE